MKIIVIALCFLAVGCAGNTPWENPQQYAGITHVDAKWKADSNELERIEVWSGKEGQSFDIIADIAKGKVSWSGKEVRSFQAFESRAEVEKMVAEKFADAAPDIRKGIVDIVAGMAGL